MLSQETVFESDNVGRNPGRGPSHSGEAAMCDHIVAFRDDELVFIAQGIWRRADKSEQSFAARADVRAVLDVLRRPERFGPRVVTLVEQLIRGSQGSITSKSFKRHQYRLPL